MTDVVEVANESTQLWWISESRLVRVRRTRDAILERWIRTKGSAS